MLFHQKKTRQFTLIMVLVILMIFTTVALAASPSWQTIGTAKFSGAGFVGFVSMTLDSNGTPYVAYADWGNSIKASVMTFNGNNWVHVGSPGFSAGAAREESLVLDSNDTPYLAYRDYTYGSRTTVMKYTGSGSTGWEPVGSVGFSTGTSNYLSMALDTNDMPYVAFQDAGHSWKARVMKFNGTNWVNIGPVGFTPDKAFYTSLVLDSNNIPYIAFHDSANSNKVSVMKFNGTSWEQVGSAGFSAGAVHDRSLSMVMDDNNTPYVSFQDVSNSYKVTVMTFNGTSWELVGSAGFASAASSYTAVGTVSLALDGNGMPYVSFSDTSKSNKASVMKFNGISWELVGTAGFSTYGPDWFSLALDGSDTPYLAYRERYNDKLTVKAFVAPPEVLYNANTIPGNGTEILGQPQIKIEFDQVVKSGSIDSGSAEDTDNYLLVNAGANGSFDTLSCIGGVVADDISIIVDSVVYNGSGPSIATLSINGGQQLPLGNYRLFICGTTSVENLAGQELNDGLSDAALNFTVVDAPYALPETGFPLGQVTSLSTQPDFKAYSSTDLVLEVPSLGVEMKIVGVPLVGTQWDVSWLGSNVGWLNNTAFPTWEGNTVLTAHVWDVNNNPGPFADLKDLHYGDQFYIHAFGQVYTYEVRDTWRVRSNNLNVLAHSDYDIVTLMTCESWSIWTGEYQYRRVVRAVLVDISMD